MLLFSVWEVERCNLAIYEKDTAILEVRLLFMYLPEEKKNLPLFSAVVFTGRLLVYWIELGKECFAGSSEMQYVLCIAARRDMSIQLLISNERTIIDYFSSL